EVPLLGVLPGTGGLTRGVDKRRVRRDRAGVFATLAEGLKGKRAGEGELVGAIAPRSQFDALVSERAHPPAALSTAPKGKGVTLDELRPEVKADSIQYRHVHVGLDRARRTATVTVHAPEEDVKGVDAIERAGASWWPLRAFRELDDALLRLRFNH